jgi:hypothetical protein
VTLAIPAESVTTRLAKYLEPKLAGSSLQIIHDGGNQMTVFAGEDISLKVEENGRKSLEFSLFSPKLNRIVTFEEINDAVFLDVRLNDELKAENHEAEEADISLAIDLVEVWARENGYSFTHKA